MKTINAYLRKEFIESIRQYKFLILGIGILIFAILDPIMLKLLPVILKTQTQYNMDTLFQNITIKMGIQNYIKDLFQVSIMFVVFTTTSTLGEEVSNKKLVFPYSKGASREGIVISKFINYTVATIILLSVGIIINYYYVNILFDGENIKFGLIMKNIVYISLYFSFNIALSMMIGLFLRKSIAAGVIVLAIGYISAGFSSIKSILNYLPYNLIFCSSSIEYSKVIYSVISTLLLTILTLFICIRQMNKVEVA